LQHQTLVFFPICPILLEAKEEEKRRTDTGGCLRVHKALTVTWLCIRGPWDLSPTSRHPQGNLYKLFASV